VVVRAAKDNVNGRDPITHGFRSRWQQQTPERPRAARPVCHDRFPVSFHGADARRQGRGLDARSSVNRASTAEIFFARQHVRHRYATCCRPAGIEGHITVAARGQQPVNR
jgi:hypothetical protein